MPKISQLESAVDITASDLIQIVDVEDSGMAPSGTNKKATASLLVNQLVPLINNGSIPGSKIENGGITSEKILNETIVNGDVSSTAAIAGTKISPNFGSQNITTTGSASISAVSIGIGNGSIGTNTICGNSSLSVNTSGDDNSAFGYNSLKLNTSGQSNSAFGSNSLSQNSTGSENSAFGNDALLVNSTGSYNVAIGQESLSKNTIGYNNSALGGGSLRSNVIGIQNTAIGSKSLELNTASNNTAIGRNALALNTTGASNSSVGKDCLSTNVSFSNCSGLGANAQVTGSDQVQLGDSTTTVYAYGAVQNRSDVRDKADIRDTQLGLDFILALRPVDYKWDLREDYRPEWSEGSPVGLTEDELNERDVKKSEWLENMKLSNITHDGSKKRNRYHHGLIAQEVKAVIEETGVDFGGFQDHSINGGDDVLSIGYGELIAPLIKAVQELKARVDELENA